MNKTIEKTISYVTIKEKNRPNYMTTYIDDVVTSISLILGNKESTEEEKKLAIIHGDILNDAHRLMGTTTDGEVFSLLMKKYLPNEQLGSQ